MAKSDDEVLAEIGQADVMTLEENDGEDMEMPSRPQVQVTISDNQHKQIISFLNHYGIDTDDMTVGEAFEKYHKIQNLAEEQVQVLSRGAVTDSFERLLDQYVPKGFKGEYFHDSNTEMDRAKALGWVPAKAEGNNRDSPTGKTDGLVRLGDLVLFIIPEEGYAAKQIARERRHAERRAKRKREQVKPSQGAQGIDPMGGRSGAHPDHPIRPLSDLRG